jgi:hypothetical protein
MASTAFSAKLPITKTCLAGGRRMACGIAALTTGTVELDTGLNSVDCLVCTAVGDTDTEAVAFRIREDLPSTSGVLTVDGTKLDEGQAVANAGSEQFCWFAIGR